MPSHSHSQRPRILSGMRPTGKLHLGNYVGALQNWVKLQDGGAYDCFFFIADWHALTTDYDDTSRLAANTVEVVLDYLGAGLDSNKSTLFVQSHVLQHAELHVLFSMITPLGWLERVPSYKDQQQNMPNKDLHMYGFLGYPLLQAADILIYRPKFVPVGEDQVSHVELTREVARRFNSFFSESGPRATKRSGIISSSSGDNSQTLSQPAGIFPEPEALLTASPKLLGTDKRKMSKSYGNSILLSDPAQEVENKINNSVTDRPKLSDRGSPDRCPVGNLHQIFSSQEVLAKITEGCTTATITCVECKQLATDSVNAHLEPIRERRRALTGDPDKLRKIIREGADKARSAAEETMAAVRRAVGLLGSEFVPSVTLERSGNPVLRVPQAAAGAASERERQDIVINAWVESVSGNHPLRKDRPRTFITRKARKVGVHAARQNQDENNRGENEHQNKDEKGSWEFRLPDRPLNVLVLLAEDQEGCVQDYVLPPRLLQDYWKHFEREGSGANAAVRISLVGGSGGPFIRLQQNKVPIRQYQGDYSALQ